jgi:2',3'-cyclic-nucleotide 2'-phosphodiesterase/3'-nucleotidase
VSAGIAPRGSPAGYCAMLFLPLFAGLALAPADTVRIVLVATTDLHGYVTDWDDIQNAPWPGGLARAATVIDSLRDRYPGQVVLVDAGDALQGSPLAAYFGRVAQRDPHPVIDAMNLIEYDAATPGDHDFDFGLDLFNRALSRATFPFVSGNLRALPADSLALKPYVVVTRNGVRLAIAGLTTPAAMVSNRARLRGRLRVERIGPAVEGLLREMRKDADLAVLLVHSGLSGPASYDTTGIGGENVAARLAGGAERPDLVVAGHSHEEIVDSVIGGVHFVQPRAEGGSLAVVHIALVPRGDRLVPVRIEARRVLLGDVRPSSRLARRLADPHAAALNWAATVVGEAGQALPLAAARVEDAPLMRFVTEVMRRASGATLAAAPVLDPRGGLAAGEISMGALFRLYPAEHTLRAVRITGAQLRAFLEQCARYFYSDATGRVATNRFVSPANYDVVGGAEYTIDLSRAPGDRVTRLRVRGRPVLPTDTLTLALPGPQQQGIGPFSMLAGAPVVYDKGEYIRDLLAAEIRRRRLLRAADFAGSSWNLAPADYARRARALFVREAAAAPAPVEPPPPEPVLPRPVSREELARRDSVRRAEERSDSAARATVASLRLPAEPGPGRGLGRLLADAYRNALRADVAIVESGEPGSTLPAGGLTRSQIEASAPAGARLLSLGLSGAELQQVLEHLVEQADPCCELAGVRVEYDPRGRPLDRVRRVRLLSGRSIEDKRTYTLAISDRLVVGDSLFTLGGTDCRGGKGCRKPGLLSRWKVERPGLTAADALREYLRRLPQPVSPPEDRRLAPSR